MEVYMPINAIDQLREDHKNLLSVMDELEDEINNNTGNYQDLFQEFKQIFNMHDKAEDEIVYPVLKEYPDLNKLILKGYQAHHVVEVGILELRITPYTSETWGPKFLVVKDSILSHMTEEEQQLFPLATNHLDQQKLQQMGEEINKSR
jgi:hemerythrin superfamily protein